MRVMEREIVASIAMWLILFSRPFVAIYANMEGDALHSLRANLNDPNNVLQSWDPTLVNPCTWFHVTCNNDNSVIRVDLGNAALSGQLVPQLGQLRNLQYLELYSNNISGTIPSDLGNLTSLVSLDLYLNTFSGPIPDSLGKLNKLRFLVVKSTMQSLAGMAIEDVDPSGVMRKARNSLRREVDRSNRLSMTEEEKQRRRSRQRQLYREKKEANATGWNRCC